MNLVGTVKDRDCIIIDDMIDTAVYMKLKKKFREPYPRPLKY